MKFLALLLIFAFIGKISASPAYPPRFVYRGEPEESQESSEIEEAQSDEAEVKEVPQSDDASDEDDDPPPKFSKLFPAPGKNHGRPGATDQNLAFASMMQEIDQNAWKRPKEVPQTLPVRSRSALAIRRFRDDDDESEEDDDVEDEEEDDLEDDISEPEIEEVFQRNDEGKMSDGAPVQVTEGRRLRFRQIPFGRVPYGYRVRGRSSQQGPVYYSTKMPSRQNVRFVRVNPSSMPSRRVSSSPVSYAQNPFSYGGNRRHVSVPVTYRHQRPVAVPMSVYRQRPVSSSSQRVVYAQSVHRQRQPTGPVYVDNYGRQQYYVSSPVRRAYSPMTYGQRPRQVQYQSRPYYAPVQYGMRNRRNYNGRFWNKK